MLKRAKNTVLISFLSIASRFAFTAFVAVSFCFALASSPTVRAFAEQTGGLHRQAVTTTRMAKRAGASHAQQSAPAKASAEPTSIFGYRDFSKQRQWDHMFLAVPSPARAEQHLKILTAQPHLAGSPQDKLTADYVAKMFKVAGLETETVPYRNGSYGVHIILLFSAPHLYLPCCLFR